MTISVSTACSVIDENGQQIGVIQFISGEPTAREFGDWLHISKVIGKEKELIATKVVLFTKKASLPLDGRTLSIKDSILLPDGSPIRNALYKVSLKKGCFGLPYKQISGDIIIYPELIFDVISAEDMDEKAL